METFIKTPSLLEEVPSAQDLFECGKDKELLISRIDGMSKSGIIAVVAEYGRGKSTLIKSVETDGSRGDEKWIEFEAWKMPGRKDLWEGFLLEVARSKNQKEFDKILGKIDGTQKNMKQHLLGVVSKGVELLAGIPGFSSVADKLGVFLADSPATRVFQMQDLLVDLIDSVTEKKIIIVAEDIDRSGDNGIYFLETLRQFIRDSTFRKQLIVIVPVAVNSYKTNKEAYLKCIDIIDSYTLTITSLDVFLKELLMEDAYSELDILRVSDLLVLLMRSYPKTTIRQIKEIFRRADSLYRKLLKKGLVPDWRVCLVVEASKAFKSASNADASFYDTAILQGGFSSDTVFGKFLFLLSTKSDERFDSQNEHSFVRRNSKGYECKFVDSANIRTETDLAPLLGEFIVEDHKHDTRARIYDVYL